MKKVLIGLVAVGVLLIAAILIAPSFIDWNAHKKQIAALVQDATGRQLTIRGNIDVTILASPALRVEDVRLASVPGAVSPEMIRLPEARISVAFAPLLEGQLAVVVTLIRPVVNLEKMRDGRGNWDFSEAQETPGAGDAPSRRGRADSGLPLDIKLDSFQIVDGSVGYHDAATGTLERVEKLNSEISFDSLDGPFRVDGTATVRGVPIALKVSTGVVREDAPLSTIVEIAIPESESTLRLNGTLAGRDGAPAVTGVVEVNSKSAASLLASLTGAEILGRLAQPLTMQGSLSAGKESISLKAVDIELGAARATGDLTVQLGDKPTVTMAVRTGNLNLDAFLDGGAQDPVRPPKAASGKREDAGAGDGKSAAVPVNQVKTAATGGFAIPNIPATLTAEAGIVQLNGALVRDLALKASLKDGRATVDDLSAILPGSTSFGVTGSVGAKDGAPDMDLALSSRSDNLREMLEWVGVDTASVPADRLRRFSMSASITGAPRNVIVKDINVQLDTSKLSGGLALVMRDRPAFGLRLVVDRVNVDGYLSGGRNAPIGGGTAGGGALPGGKDGDDAKDTVMGGVADALAFLEKFDANIDATIKNFIVARAPASDLHVDVTVLNGGLEVRKAEIGDLAGLRGSVKGTLDRSKEKPAIVADYSVEILDVARFSRFVEKPSLMEYRGHGRIASSGKIDGNVDQLAVNARLQALGMTVGVNGVLTALLQSPAFKLATSISAPELVQVVRLVDDGYAPAAGKLGPVDLTFQLEGSQTRVKAESITGHAGPVTLHGAASLAMTDPRPKLQAKIATSEVSLDLFLPPEIRRRSAAPAVHRIIPAAVRPTSAPIGSRWSSDPIDTTALAAFDADVDLEVAVLAKDPYRFKDSKLQFRLEEGKLALDRFFANFSTGTIVATGTVVPEKDVLVAAMKFDASGVDVSDVIEALKDYQVHLGPVRFGAKMSGPITLTGELKTEGASEYQLVSALNGSARLTGQLRTATSGESRQASAVAGLAGALLGKKVKEIRGVTDVVQGTDLLVSAFDGPATLNGDISIENGVLTTNNLVLVGRGGRALTTGTANLPEWRLDSVTDVTLGQDEDPYVTAQVTGALDDPYLRKVSGTLLRGRPVSTPPPPPAGTTGSDATGKQSADGQAGPRIVSPQEAEKPTPAAEKIKPEDVIKGLLQGLSR